MSAEHSAAGQAMNRLLRGLPLDDEPTETSHEQQPQTGRDWFRDVVVGRTPPAPEAEQ